MTARVLIVEDEAPIRMGLCDVLAFHGLAPSEARDGVEGLQQALSTSYDLVILDVMMPRLDGVSVCRQLRAQRPGQAILMLTAKGDEASVLAGFDAGADDYVSKPFSVAQLMARVRALLRRSGARPPAAFVVGPLQIDGDALTARHGERSVELSPRDVQLLAHLQQHAGRPVPREELLAEVWGFARVDRVETRCVDMHVVKLRRKLAELSSDEVVHTVRGVGYRVDAP
jgi:DNA-binding response OmpR family regulator